MAIETKPSEDTIISIINALEQPAYGAARPSEMDLKNSLAAVFCLKSHGSSL